MRTLDREQDRPNAVDGKVTLLRPVGCMRCGTETSGTATCGACRQALDELRGLATDSRGSLDASLWLSDRPADLR